MITIGADVEMFANRNGVFVSAIPFIGDILTGTKYNPIKFSGGHTLQRDNVACEFATAVANSRMDFVGKIKTAMDEANRAMPSGVNLRCVSSVVFSDEELSHPEALEFGCDPDFCAWKNGAVNPRPSSKNPNLRTAGGHIHIGSPILKTKKNKMRMIRMMDVYLGLWSVVKDTSPESLMRKELYGKAGAFRPTPYGVEYRSLSNFWIQNDQLVSKVWELSISALKAVENGVDVEVINSLGGGDEITNCINTGNVKIAKIMRRGL